jgi:hypothetical protein
MSSSAARYFPQAFGKGITPSQADAQNAQTSSTEAARAERLGQPNSTAATASSAKDVVASLAAPSDEVLIALICDGDKEALASLFRTTHASCVGLHSESCEILPRRTTWFKRSFCSSIATAKRSTAPEAAWTRRLPCNFLEAPTAA